MEKEWKSNAYGLDFVEIFKARGVAEKDMAMFVDPYEFAKETDPLQFRNMDRAVAATKEAIENKCRILVVADVDTDGVTSGAMVYNYLVENFDVPVKIIIGNGKQHGLTQLPYDLFTFNVPLIIACDSGSDEHELYETLAGIGCEIVLLDHHKPDYEDENVILVNPEMWPVENSELSGAGVCLKFLQLLAKETNTKGELPYDLAAVGIVADMMDMRKEDNRKICSVGFKRPSNKGVLELAGKYEFNSETVSFSIAPLINAAQRMGRNELALKVFLNTTPEAEIKQILGELKKLKEMQKELTEKTLNGAKIKETNKLVLGICDSEAGGLSGLVANKLSKEKQKPTIFVREDGDMLRGSMRSFGVDNFKTLINKTNLAQAEGHESAAGFSVKTADLDNFLFVLEKELPDVLQQTIVADAELDDLSELNHDNVSFIEKVNRVTGECFKPITIMVSGVKPDRVFAMSGKHTKIVFGSTNLIMWNNTKPVDDWSKNKWRSFDIIGKPTISRYGGGIDVILDEIDYELEE